MIPNDYLSTFTLPTIPNHASRDITERVPWEGASTVPPPGWSKVKVRQWHANAGTRHLYYSPYEADNPTLRMSKENGPRLMRALCVDYDCYSLAEETLTATLNDVNPALAPAFVSRSHSGGVHALWLFEEPIWVMSADLRKRLLGWFKRHLKLSQFLPGMDEKVYYDAMLYFACGSDWQQLDSQLVTTKTTARAFMECGAQAHFKGHGVAIPLEIVATEVEARFPGRWQGEFEENSRGVRFWDAEGDAQSAIVKNEGMLCYTGDKGFLDWASIFGRPFVEKYLDDKVGGAADCAWFDGRDYWIWAEQTQSWRVAKSDEMARKMKVEFGLDSSPIKGDTSSEVDKAMHHICERNLVKSAGPFVHRPAGIIFLEGARHLNTACIKACQPAEGDCGPDDWPWIENFLNHVFTQVKESHDQLLMDFASEPQEQLFRFLAWLQHAYTAALNFTPTQGHVLVLAGEPGSGKTLLADVFIAGALGGKKDASAFLLGETKFNRNLYNMPVWVVNDAVAASDPSRKNRYNSLVKKVAANREFEMEAKFHDAVDVAWQGRLVITCNVDPESIQVMPQLDSSMGDKVLALRVWGGDGEDDDSKQKATAMKWFGKWEGRDPGQNIRHELPMFLNWLLKWEKPSWIKSDVRFGMESYHHPELKEQADSSSYYSSFNEVVGVFLHEYFTTREDMEEWKGSATELLEELQKDTSPVKSSTKNYSGSQVGRNLANLVNRSKCQKRTKDGRSLYYFGRKTWSRGAVSS